MQITLLGTGSCTPYPTNPLRSYSGWYITIGDSSLLFDIGGGVLHKLLQDGVDVMRSPTHLFISHFHPDHCSDIIQLMQGRGVYSRDVEMLKKLFLAGPDGLNTFIEQALLGVDKWNSFGTELQIKNLLDLNEIMNGVVIESTGFKVSCTPIEHFNGVCYKLETNGKTIVYSGDMGYDETISEFGHGADIAILECTSPDRATLKGKHLCPEDIGNLAKLGEFKKVVLTHMLPSCAGREEEMINVIKGLAGCEVAVGQDMLKIEV